MEKEKKVTQKKVTALTKRIKEYYTLAKHIDDVEKSNRGVEYLSKQIYGYVIKPQEDKQELLREGLQAIIDIGFDYDGYHSEDHLKDLIDELVEIARNSIDGAPIYRKI